MLVTIRETTFALVDVRLSSVFLPPPPRFLRYIPPKLLKISPAASKRKKVAGFSEKLITMWKKLPYPPQPIMAGGMEVLGGGGIYPPYPPRPCLSTVLTSPMHCSNRMSFSAIWTLLFFAVNGILIYQTRSLIVRYFSYPSSVVTMLEFEMLNFPSVTICNQNPIGLYKIGNVSYLIIPISSRYLLSHHSYSLSNFLQNMSENLLDKNRAWGFFTWT